MSAGLDLASTSPSAQRGTRYVSTMYTTRRRRQALILLVTAAAAGCLALAWWQWTRFESNSGGFQNLGYAFQWPLFACFCVYAYFKFVRFEESPPEPRSLHTVTEIPAGLLPELPGPTAHTDYPTLREYNTYLAELAKADAELATADAELAKADSDETKTTGTGT